MPHANIGIDLATFKRIAALYRQRWKVALYATSPDGRLVLGEASCQQHDDAECSRIRRLAVESAVRWGEPAVEYCPGHRMVWAVPLMHNAAVLGGLVASAAERDVLPAGRRPPAVDVRAACTELRQGAERENLTNAAFLAERRAQYRREQEKAQAIHEFKVRPNQDDIRAMYLQEEPALIAAIRRDDRPAARQIINDMLVAMLFRAGESLSLSKSFFLELVVTMTRTAVEAGGKPEELLGSHFQSLSELARIDSQERLARWLHENLDHVMDAIGSAEPRPASLPVTLAMEFMAEHLGEDITRDDIARAAHLSSYHFSRLFKEQMGRSCNEMLNQLRVDRAAEMLVRTGRAIVAIAIECGFKDQSYFTKVFRRHIGKPPGEYRRTRAAGER